jgi:polyisoprenoid-binding protein YceI
MSKKMFSLLAVLGFLAVTTVRAEEYGFDKAHSHVGFSVKHILSNTPGGFKDYDGTITFDEKKPEASTVDVTIQAASIDTGNEMRDKHLRAADFFDTDKFPTLTFKSTKVTVSAPNKYQVAGDLTIHGVTKPVVLDVDYLGSDSMKMGDGPESKLVGFSATTKINRQDFGLAFNKVLASGNLMVGNEVTITLDVAGQDKASLKAMAEMMKSGKGKKGGKKK